MTFNERPKHELARTGDAELIAYVVAAREAGRADEARTALGMFVFRRLDDLVRRAKAKVESDQDAEDLAMQTIEDALDSAFAGTSPGEAVNLMKTVLSRRIADFYRERERKPPPQDLPEERDDEDRKRRDAAVSRDDKGGIIVQDAIDREYARLRDDHKLVVDLRVFAGFGSKEAADQANAKFPDLDPAMSADNVDKIVSRFRKVMRGELGDED